MNGVGGTSRLKGIADYWRLAGIKERWCLAIELVLQTILIVCILYFVLVKDYQWRHLLAVVVCHTALLFYLIPKAVKFTLRMHKNVPVPHYKIVLLVDEAGPRFKCEECDCLNNKKAAQ